MNYILAFSVRCILNMALLLAMIMAFPAMGQDLQQRVLIQGKRVISILRDTMPGLNILSATQLQPGIHETKQAVISIRDLQKDVLNNGVGSLPNLFDCHLKSVNPGFGKLVRELKQQVGRIMIPAAAFKGIAGRLANLMHPGGQSMIKWNGAAVRDEGLVTNGGAGMEFYHRHGTSASAVIAGVPVLFNLYTPGSAGDASGTRMFSFRFDRAARSQLAKSGLTNLGAAGNVPGLLQDLAAKARKEISTGYSRLEGQLIGKYTSRLQDLGVLNTAGLSGARLQQIEDRLSDVYDSLLTTHEKRLEELYRRNDGDSGAVRQTMDSLNTAIRAADKMLPLIRIVRQQMEKFSGQGVSLLQDGIKLADKLSPTNGSQREEAILLVGDRALSMTPWQNLFAHISSLHAGTGIVNASPLTVWHFPANGANISFSSHRFYLFLMAAKPERQPGETTFTSAVKLANRSTAFGTRMGRGELGGNHDHFSVFWYNQPRLFPGEWLPPILPGVTTVTAFSHRRQLGEQGWLAAEMARSNHIFPGQDKLSSSRLPSAQLPEEAPRFTDQVALTLDLSNTVQPARLSYGFHLTRTGRGFYNPGNMFIPSGTTVVSANIRKSTLHSRVSLYAKAGYNSQAGSGNGNWSRVLLSLRTRVALRKGQYVSVSWSPSFLSNRGDQAYTGQGYSSQLLLDGSFCRRFGLYSYQHAFTLMFSTGSAMYNSIHRPNRQYTISSMQVVSKGGHGYYLSVQAGHVSEWGQVAPGAELTLDAGSSYRLGKWLTASSALSYIRQYGWYTGAGIKQSLNGRLGSRFNVTVFTSLFKTIQGLPDPFRQTSYSQWSLAYTIK